MWTHDYKPLLFKDLNIRIPSVIPLFPYNPYITLIYYIVVSIFFSIIPIITPVKGRGFIHHGSTL